MMSGVTVTFTVAVGEGVEVGVLVSVAVVLSVTVGVMVEFFNEEISNVGDRLRYVGSVGVIEYKVAVNDTGSINIFPCNGSGFCLGLESASRVKITTMANARRLIKTETTGPRIFIRTYSSGDVI
jgi:hypothetical protein